MPEGINPQSVKRFLLNGCGYHGDLLRDNYEFARGELIDVAAFAHRPFDARSACLAVIESRNGDPQDEVLNSRRFGAPVVFVCAANRLQVWKPGPRGADCLERGLTARQLPRYFRENESNLNPRRIYDAKTLGRLPGSDRQLELFVDPGLLPYAERQIGGVLTDRVVQVVRMLEESFSHQLTDTQRDWTFKSAFRLLAGKILQDKGVPRFIRLRLTDVDSVFQRVHRHYGTSEPVRLGRPPQRRALQAAAEELASLGSLCNLTTEALADVYEQALITEETRPVHGTHGTPSYLVDYIVWQLAPWIEQIPTEELRVFEPGCGHAPFLVAIMRLLRNFDLGMQSRELSSFFRSCLFGIETDSFALEIAKLSLTVADEPNPNGWNGLQLGDMFRNHALEQCARRSRVLLANPPYEHGKALTMLQRALPELPDGGVFGFVAPATVLSSEKRAARELRTWMTHNCQLKEVGLFPDDVFKFSDQECTVILGRKLKMLGGAAGRTRLRRVREEDRSSFRVDYRFTTDRVCPQARFLERPYNTLWVPDLYEEVWCWLEGYTQLEALVDINQGLQHKGKRDRPSGALTVQPIPFGDGVAGFASSRGDWYIHQQPRVAYLNLRPEVIRRPGSGAETGRSQVVANYHPAGRRRWRLKPFLDRDGHPVTSSFITLRPLVAELPLEYIWAICCSPLANAYVYTHCSKRDIHVGDLRRLPVPEGNDMGIRRVIDAARRYLAGAQAGVRTLFSSGVSESDLHSRLIHLDSEVLRLYGLPARAERKLLDPFRGEQRPGVPVSFTGYYPDDFTRNVPLYAYLSDSFQRSLNGGDPSLPPELDSRYKELVERSDAGTLTPDELEELYEIQAEVDGRDYALQIPDDSWLEDADERQGKADVAVGALTNRAIETTRRGAS